MHLSFLYRKFILRFIQIFHEDKSDKLFEHQTVHIKKNKHSNIKPCIFLKLFVPYLRHNALFNTFESPTIIYICYFLLFPTIYNTNLVKDTCKRTEYFNRKRVDLNNIINGCVELAFLRRLVSTTVFIIGTSCSIFDSEIKL